MEYKYYDIIENDYSINDLNLYYEMNNYITKIINNGDKQTLVKLLPKLKSEDNWYGCAGQIFNFIYSDPSLNEYTFYLLHKGYIKPETLRERSIENILKNTIWGLEYIFNNLERILSRDSLDVKDIITVIINHIKDDKEKYNYFYKELLPQLSEQSREKVIASTLRNHVQLNYKLLLRALYKNADEYDYPQEKLPFVEVEPNLIKSQIPHLLSFYADRENEMNRLITLTTPILRIEKSISIKKFIIDNFNLLFKVEQRNKMELLEEYIEYIVGTLSKEELSYYKELLRIYRTRQITDTDQAFSALINHNKDRFILDFIKNKEVSYVSSGTTTRVFKVDDKVLKLSNKKHFLDTEKDLYLLAPTETEILYDEENNPVLIIEIQDYLDKTYEDKQMEKQDIYNLMDELDNKGYVTTDPNCLQCKTDNFGFLKSYKDANCSDPESLPDWFKERPVVMYDIDLVYKKEYPNKKHFNY